MPAPPLASDASVGGDDAVVVHVLDRVAETEQRLFQAAWCCGASSTSAKACPCKWLRRWVHCPRPSNALEVVDNVKLGRVVLVTLELGLSLRRPLHDEGRHRPKCVRVCVCV